MVRYYVYKDAGTPSLWRWTLYAANNRKIANSGESYRNYNDCIAAIDLVAGSDGAPIDLAPNARIALQRLGYRV